MVYSEVSEDLFNNAGEYALAHCISADCKLGKGIDVEFAKRFNTKNLLQIEYPNYVDRFNSHSCLIIDNGKYGTGTDVLNLVTKKYYYNKPTIESMRGALEDMKVECLLRGIKKVAMPKIGCGLDRLSWNDVKNAIFEVFSDTNMEIKVCFY